MAEIKCISCDEQFLSSKAMFDHHRNVHDANLDAYLNHGKCYVCGHVFIGHEPKWVGLLLPCLCDYCHDAVVRENHND